MAHEDELAALGATPVVLRALLVGGVDGGPAGDEGWSAREVVAHLRDCEEFRLERCHLMRDETEPLLAAFDQEALALERDYKSVSIDSALDAFAEYRERVVQLLAELSDEQWERTGMHEESGRITIVGHIRHAISHDLLHLRQIAQSLARDTATGPS